MAVDELLDRGGDAAEVTPYMMTFGAFERRLRAEALGPSRVLDGFGRSLLLSDVIDGYYRRRGGSLEPAMTRAGFNAALLSFFDELGAGLVSPEGLASVRGYAPSKEDEIAGLYESYRLRLSERGFVDEGVLRQRLIEALADGAAFETPILRRAAAVVLRDIYQFTPYRFELFRLIAKKIPVTIVVPLPDERAKAFGFIVSNIEKFESLAEAEGGLSILYEEPYGGPLEPLRGRIFSLAPGPAPGGEELGEAVEMLRLSSRYREIEEIGARIISLREETGARWGDFGLVLRDVRPYGPMVEDIFRRYRIPYRMRRGLSLGQSPASRAFFSLFEAIAADFERESVLRVLSSPYFGRFEKLDIDAARGLFLKAGIMDGSSRKWRAALKNVPGKDRPAGSAKIVAETIGLIRKLESFSGMRRPADFFAALKDILEFLDFGPGGAVEGPMSETARFRDNSSLALLRDIITGAARSVESLGARGSGAGFDGLRGLLETQVDARDIPDQAAADENRVAVLGAHDAVGASFRFLFIGGLIEGEFPRRIETGSILNDMEKEKFNQAWAAKAAEDDPGAVKGRRVFDKAADKWREESLLFFQTLKTAKERVTLTYSQMELDGSLLMRSQFMDDVLDVLAPGALWKDREALVKEGPKLAIQKSYEELIDPEEKKTRLLMELFRGGLGEDEMEKMIAGAAAGRAAWGRFVRLLGLSAMERGRDAFFHETVPSMKRGMISPHNGLLAGAEDLVKRVKLENEKGRHSPTDLEKLGQCPFRYFAGRLLKLEPAAEPEPQLDARRTGSLQHEILEDFYGRLIEKGEAERLDGPMMTRRMEESARRVFEKYEKQGKQGDPAVWRTQKERTLIQLAIAVKKEVEERSESGFVPAAVEARFDLPEFYEGSNPPLKIKGKDGVDRLLVGSIDRIDVNKEKKEVRVIDYKLGANTTRYRKLVRRENMGKTSFQLPAYMLLARNYVLGSGLLDEVRRLHGGYRLLGAVKKRDVLIRSADAGAEEDAGFETALLGAMELAEGGVYPPDPESCDYCDFPSLCRLIAAPGAETGGDG